jgi:uncharacterized protein YceH (UPF0502 family)
METDVSQPTDTSSVEPRWKPLPAIHRRIIGVLVEKAKTTPDAYPLSLNALTTGCNQKSNRSPHMNLTTEQVDEALEQLRYLGAVSEVQGGGRVPRYRHYLKDWLGVDGTELAVMAELLVRGAQTIGELRGRAARMAPIGDVGALKPVLASLIVKGLVVALTPEGRGQIVAHTLYEPREMDQLKAQYGEAATTTIPDASPPIPGPTGLSGPATGTEPKPAPAAASSAAYSGTSDVADEIAGLKREMSRLKDEIARLRSDIDDLWSNLR